MLTIPFAVGARALTTQTQEPSKPKSAYVEEAVQLAGEARWEEAVELNRYIIDSFGADEETQNRLGKALSELGKLKDAKSAYEVALKLNPMNSIAKKNAARINTLLHQKEGLKVVLRNAIGQLLHVLSLLNWHGLGVRQEARPMHLTLR